MTLPKFYKKLLESIGLSVDKNGKITMDGTPLLLNKLPMYVYIEGVNDDIILDKKGIPFNVLSENVLDGVSKPLLKVISVFEMQLNLMLKSMVAVFLERLHTEYEYPPSLLFKMEGLYKELEEATARSKTKIDELKLENYNKSIMKNIDFDVVKVRERHKVEFEGEVFSSGIVAQYPILKDLEEALEEDTKLGNSKMRKSDLRVYMAIFKHFTEELGKIYGVSNIDGISDTTAFMKAIIHVNRFIKDNSAIVEESDVFFNGFKDILTVKDISIAQKLRKEAEFTPTVLVDDDKVQVVETARVTKKPKNDDEYITPKRQSATSDEYIDPREALKRIRSNSNNAYDEYDDEYVRPKKRRRRRPVRDEFFDDDDEIDEFFKPRRKVVRDEYFDDDIDDFFREDSLPWV